MSTTTLLIIVLFVLLFGSGSGYWAHQTYGPNGSLSVSGLVFVVLLILFLFR